MILAITNREEQVFNILAAGRKAPNFDLDMASRIAQIFGRCCSQLRELSASQKKLDEIRNAFGEIQVKFLNGTKRLDSLSFPFASGLLSKFPRTEKRAARFSQLQKQSLDCAAFLLFQTKFPQVDAARTTRFNSLQLLNQVLEGQKEQLEDKEKVAIVKLLCNAGVLQKGAFTSYFLEALRDWGQIEKIERLKSQIPFLTSLIAPISQGEAIRLTFHEYIVEVTIQYLKDNLRIPIEGSLLTFLKKSLVNEVDRSDIVCWLANSRASWDEDWKSRSLLVGLQIYHYWSTKYELKEELKPQLLEICLRRSMGSELPDEFRKKTDPEEPKKLEIALGVVRRLKLKSNDQETYSLLLFFLENGIDVGERLIRFFESIRDLPGMELNAQIIRAFCAANIATPEPALGILSNSYEQVLRSFERSAIRDSQTLFLDPPVQIQGKSTWIGGAADQTGRFLKMIAQYQFAPKAPFFSLLREFVFKPNSQLFDLVQSESKNLKVEKIDEDFLREVISQGTQLHGAATAEEKSAAAEMVRALTRTYAFTDANKFCLFLEILSERNLVPFREVSQFIEQLREQLGFIPSTQMAYFFYRYHPAILDKKIIGSLVETRKFLIRRSIGEFQIHTYEYILGEINRFWQQLFPNQEQIQIEGKKLMFSLFFPPLQPLTDMIQISGLTKAEGIQWMSDHVKSHEGQLKQVPGTPFHMHLNWHINASNHPTLSMSAIDLKTRSAASAQISLPLYAPTEQVDRAHFFGTLFQRGLQYLKSEEPLAPMAEGVEAELPEQHREKILEFLEKLKISYRGIYWSMLCSEEFEVDIDPRRSCPQIAARGHLFLEGSLIPTHLLTLEERIENYTAQAERAAWRQFDSICRKGNEGITPLGELKIEGAAVRFYGRSKEYCAVLGAVIKDETVEVPLQYTEDGGEERFLIHVLMLKARVYQSLLRV